MKVDRNWSPKTMSLTLVVNSNCRDLVSLEFSHGGCITMIPVPGGYENEGQVLTRFKEWAQY